MASEANLVIPLALWSRTVPEHSITCAVVLPRECCEGGGGAGPSSQRWAAVQRVATGSSSGQICIWRVEGDEAQPTIFLSGHNSSVSALLCMDFDHNQCIVSVAIDGTVGIWATDDGLCLLSSGPFLRSYAPTSVAPLGDHQHVLVSGRHKDIALVDLMKMKIVSVLVGQHDWVSGVYPCQQEVPGTYIAFALTGEILRYWSITKNLQGMAIQTIVLDIDKIECMSFCPTSTTFIAVNKECWSLFAVSNSHRIARVECPYDYGWVGGAYVDTYHVIVWTRSGKSAMYRIPDVSDLHPCSFGEELAADAGPPAAPSPNLKQVILVHEFVMHGPSLASGRSAFAAKRRQSAVLGSRYVGACAEGALCLCNDGGDLYLWEVPTGILKKALSVTAAVDGAPEEELESSLVDSCEGEREIFTAASGTFRSGWTEATEEEEAPEAVFSEVTTSCLVVSAMVMVRGHADGCLSSHRIPSDRRERYFSSGHKGKVTALLSMSNRLLSGGEDSFIRLWDLGTGELVHEWAVHCGTILRLLPLEKHALSMAGKFLSISKDNSVGIFSLNDLSWYRLFSGPAKPIVTVKMRSDQDYLFLVYEDGMVGMWELTSCTFEGLFDETHSRERTAPATDLLQFHERPPNMQSLLLGTTSFPSYAEAGGAYATAQPQVTPINVLFLNIKRLIQSLYETAQSHKKAKIDSLLSEKTGATAAAAAAVVCPATITTTPTKKISRSVTAGHTTTKPVSRTNSAANMLSVSEADAGGRRGASTPLSAQKKRGGVRGGKRSPQEGAREACEDHLFSTLAYQVYTYLLPWGLVPELDEQARNELHLSSPYPHASIGLLGHGGKVTFAIPAFMDNTAFRWSSSEYASALHLLAAITLTKSLLQLGKHKNPLSNVLTFFYALLAEKVPNYVRPSLGFTTNFWQDEMEDVLRSTQTIFFSALDAQTPDKREEFVRTWAHRLRHNPLMKGTKTKALAPIVLGILGADRPAALQDLELQAAVSKALVELLFLDKTTVQVLAAECLGKGYRVWKNHVASHQRLILKLFSLTLLESERKQRYIRGALTQIGAEVPLEFVMALGNPRAGKFNPREHSAALAIIAHLVQKSAPALLPELSTLVEAVLRSLDPKSHSRESCLSAATDILKLLIAKYPMIDVDHDSQRLVVGDGTTIYIYDLKSCAKVYTLKGHTSAVAALTFSVDGKSMASYAIDEANVRIWQTTPPLFGFGYPPRCLLTHPVSKLTRPLTGENILETIKLTWNAPKLLCLVRAGEGKLTFEL